MWLLFNLLVGFSIDKRRNVTGVNPTTGRARGKPLIRAILFFLKEKAGQ